MALKMILLALTVFASLDLISGHGYMLDPPNRASLWRFIPDYPHNFEDNQYFCGGVQVQYEQNNGLCGPCGDSWSDPVPRSNENSGFFGQGVILRNYTEGSIVNVTVVVTANHLGKFSYSLCKLKDSSKPETEECFSDLKLVGGDSSYTLDAHDYFVWNSVQLPKGVKCERCVLRWHYKCGNSWGICEDGSQGMGCGDQEIFRSCADIAIY